MSFTLYELQDAYKNLLSLIEDGDDEIIQNAMKNVEDEIEIKANNYAIIIKRLEADIEMLKQESDRINQKKKSFENNVKRLKQNLEETMILLETKKLKTDKFSFNIQKNAPSLKILDEKKALENYSKTKIELDKQKLKEDIKNGLEVDYAVLESTESLRIR